MNYTKKRIIILIAVICGLNISGAAQVNTITEEKLNEVDSYIQYIMEERKIPGLALAIIHDGKVLKKNTYGLASIEHNVPVTDSSVFWLASVSKHITCSAIMMLSQKGIINIDDKIHRYLSDAPDNWKEVTIRHLMTHTSGLPASGRGSERGELSARGTYSAEQMYQNAKIDTLAFKPGEKFMYSDEGIFLLGYIIHKVSGMSFKEFMQKMIFEPSGMQSAYLQDHFSIHPNQVSGYSKREGQVIPDRNAWRLVDTEINAAGGIYATIDDMISWDATLNGVELLTKESKNQMWTSYILENGIKTHYGLGWGTQTLNNRKIIQHAGVAGTEYLKFIDDRVSIIILTNQRYMGPILRKVTEILGISPEKREEDIVTEQISKIKPDKKEIQSLVGDYEFISNSANNEIILVSITADKNQLWVEFPANKKYREKFKLVKLDNGRWMELSWSPYFRELSYEYVLGTDGAGTFLLYVTFGGENEIYIGELKRRTTANNQ